MDQTFADALRSARIIDLQDGSALGLPDTDGLVALGLTVDDRLSFTYEDQEDGDDLVLTLCHVQRREDGHWFLPSVFLPCFLNEAVAEDESLLSQGSTVRLGDRELRYSIPLESRLRLASESRRQGGPPPKPRRTSVNLEDAVDLTRPMSTIEEEAPVIESNESSDKELIQHLSTPEEVAQLACSYVCHQVALYTDLLLSAEELDFLFKAILASGESCESQMKEFVTRYTEEQEKASRATGEVGPLHEPVIFLLTDLLKANLDSVENATLWIKLLATFANFSPNLPFLIRHKVAPVVLGAMAVHGHAPQLQQYACTVLTQLATYTPPVGQKGPVREGGVDLVKYVLTNHVHDTLVLRPALRTLANLTQTYSTVANEALSLGSYTSGLVDLTQTVVLQEVERSMGILDFIEEHALPVVMETMEHHLRDLAIQTEGRRLLAFFVDEEIKATRKKSLNQLSSCRVRFQLDPNDPTSIVSTDHDSVDTSDDDDDRLRRLSANSNDSTSGTFRLHRPEGVDDGVTGSEPGNLSHYDVGREPIYSEIPELDRWDEGPLISLPPPPTSPGNTPRLRKVGIVGAASSQPGVGGAGGDGAISELSLCEFEPWDNMDPVVALVGAQITDVSDDEEINPSLKHAMRIGSEDEPIGGVKSLQDELAEIQADQNEESNDEDIDEPCNSKLTNISVMAVDHIGSESTRELGIDNPSEQSPENEDESKISIDNSEVSTSDIDLKKDKSNSLKRGVQKMFKTALRSGKNKMFSKMRQRLKFKELRTKEEQFIETSKDAVETLEGNKDVIGDDVPDLSQLMNSWERHGTGQIAGGLIIHGATTDWSVTDDVHGDNSDAIDATTAQSHMTETNLGEEVSTSPGSSDLKAPPLFLPPIQPKVKGSQNTVGRLINIWKNKESPETKGNVKEEKAPQRKHWRPFEQINNAIQSSRQLAKPPRLTQVTEPFSEQNNEGFMVKDSFQDETDNALQVSSSNKDHIATETSATSAADQMSSDTTYQAYMRRNSRRRTLGSLALLPDVGRFVTSSRASLTDAVELATWASSYNAFSGEDVQDMDQGLIQEVRVSRTKWKSVMVEMKKRVKDDTLPFKLKTGENKANVEQSNMSGMPNAQGYTNTGNIKMVNSAISELVRRPSAHRFSKDESKTNPMSFPELHNAEWYDSNVLTAKALITEHVLGVWQAGPTRVVGVLGQRAADLLVVCGAAPAVVASVREGFNLDLPLTRAHPEFTSALMDMLTGLPSGDESRLDTLDGLLLLLGPASHPYHQQVAARCGRALLIDSLPCLTATPTGTAVLQELLECVERRLVDVAGPEAFQMETLIAFTDRLKMLLDQEVWL